jgi:hypothetical protein
MDREQDELRSPANNPADKAGDTTIVDRVQELTWALLDEQLGDDEFRLLENLLLSDDGARATYTRCMQMHVDLMGHFAAPVPAGASAAGQSPVLGFLHEGTPPFGLPSIADDLKS